MGTKRDDFTKRTIDILGKRVAFICSNPDCRKVTIGANKESEKATVIGVAAHITAASPDGPRYDVSLTEEQRRHIDNGIWLCSNCATLIDKDAAKYTILLLLDWKKNAEAEIYKLLTTTHPKVSNQDLPFLEADIIWIHGGRWNRGFSPRNKSEIIVGKDLPIIFWELNWSYTITIYNNSKFDAFNVKIESVDFIQFNEITKLNKVNYLPALQNVDVSAKYKEYLESTHVEADKLMHQLVPKQLEGLCIRITYQDATREHTITTLATIVNGQFANKRVVKIA